MSNSVGKLERMEKITKQLLYKKVGEMDGFSTMNMHKEAVDLATRILSEEQLDAIAFNKALSAILISGSDIEKLKELIQTAFNRLPNREQPKARHQMLGYFCSIKDMKTALEYVSTPASGAELLFVMDVLLANNRLDEAEKLFFRGKRRIKGAMSEFDWSMLFAAMARYCERTGNLNEAEQYWLHVSELDQPVLRDALSSLVKIQIVRAWKHLQHGLGQIEKFKTNVDPATAVQLPGNHDILLADARKELETYREALEKIVPEKDLGKFGER